MKFLPNNLTFAILITDVAWRSDLTIRFSEYHSFKINDDYIGKIIFPATIDEALEVCETDYLLIQSSGHIISNFEFFEKLDVLQNDPKNMVLGFIELAEDYLILNAKCLFVNIPLWKEVGCPKFVGQIREGPKFITEQGVTKPLELSVKEEKQFIEHSSAVQGSGLVIRQLEQFGRATSLESLCKNNETIFLDTSSPYNEIHTDTIFEKIHLTNAFKQIYSGVDDISYDLNVLVDIVVSSGDGLRAYHLAQHFNAKEIVVFDINPDVLELQKRIFGISEATVYGEIVESFLEDFPNAKIDEGWKIDRFVVIKKTNTPVYFKQVDVFSFEMEDLIKSIDNTKSALFDYSDIFIYPFNYYRKPLFLVNGLYAELYSLMAGRIGATFIFGYGPGFVDMNNIEINTSVQQYHIEDLIDYSIPEEDRIPLTQSDIMFVPDSSAPRIPEQTSENPWITSFKNIVAKPKVIFKEIFVDRVVEKIVEVPVDRIVEKIVEVPVRTEIEKLPTDASIEEITFLLGYTKEQRDGQLYYTKVFDLLDFIAQFEYSFNPKDTKWSFKVSRVGFDKQIEFSNGITVDGMIKHLKMENKINAKTASRYFK